MVHLGKKHVANHSPPQSQCHSSHYSSQIKKTTVPMSHIYTVNYAHTNNHKCPTQGSSRVIRCTAVCRRNPIIRTTQEPKTCRRGEEKGSCMDNIVKFFLDQCQLKRKSANHPMFIHEDVQLAVKQLVCDIERVSEFERCSGVLDVAKVDGESVKKIIARMSFRICELEDKLLLPSVPTCSELVTRRQIMLNLINTLQRSIGSYLETESEVLKDKQTKLCELLKYLLSIENEFRYLTKSIMRQCCHKTHGSPCHSPNLCQFPRPDRPCTINTEGLDSRITEESPPPVMPSVMPPAPQALLTDTPHNTADTYNVTDINLYTSDHIQTDANHNNIDNTSRQYGDEESIDVSHQRPPNNTPNNSPHDTSCNTSNVYHVTNIEYYPNRHEQVESYQNYDNYSKWCFTGEDKDNVVYNLPDYLLNVDAVGNNFYCDKKSSQPLKKKMCALGSVWYESARQLLDSFRSCTGS